MINGNLFKGRDLVIATKHKKEKVIAPILEKEIGVHCFTNSSLDTDLFGTFTGEVERKTDPISTARNKCLMAMELGGYDLAIASEGSFGPHPSLFFVQSNDEVLFLLDKRNDLEIVVREWSTETNFHGSVITNESELKAFAYDTQFPSHGLICRKSKNDFTLIVKGITDWEKLSDTFRYFIKMFGSVYVETDMRAMYNPMRMNVIEKAAKKLVDKMKSICPVCGTPGYGVTEVRRGLPCAQCSFPTRTPVSYISTCMKCGHYTEDLYPDGNLTEDPMHCDVCNP